MNQRNKISIFAFPRNISEARKYVKQTLRIFISIIHSGKSLSIDFGQGFLFNQTTMKRSLLKRRDSILPEEYPEFLPFLDAINSTMWFVNKWDFSSDKNDFLHFMTEQEKMVTIRGLLCIAQQEIKVKRSWVNLHGMFPKPEIDAVGISFGESEVRHQRGYKKLLQVLGLEQEFLDLERHPSLFNRMNYLDKYLKKSKGDVKDYVMYLTLFTLAVENSSLFGLFAIFKVINKERNFLKDTDNVIMDTTKEENIHALFGVFLINLLREEEPELFPEDFGDVVSSAMAKSYQAESDIIDWVFEHGELPYLTKDQIKTYIKYRINYSLELLDLPKIYTLDQQQLEKFDFFELEQDSTIHVDFFHKTSPNYNKHSRTETKDSLF